jgi:fluoroquinolone resistance protein
MSTEIFEHRTYQGRDLGQNALLQGKYENCAFTHCSFANADLSGFAFSDCTFVGCDLSNATLKTAVFRNVHFRGCKLLGLHFEDCSKRLFSAAFDDCILNLSSFSSLVLKKTRFVRCTLHEADFTACNLLGSVFDSCDLTRARFDRTNLESVDLRTSWGFSINPEINRLKKAKFSLAGIPGLLEKYEIEIE